MVKYSKEKAKENNKSVTFSMTTNETLINEDIAEFFKENDFTITISIDGDSEIQNKNRYYGNHKGSYNEVIRGINILKKWSVGYSKLNFIT